SSRYALHCRLRVPGDRADPFFPLRPGRPTGTTPLEDSARLPAPRLAARAPNGIIRSPSPHSASKLPASCSSSYRAVRFVARAVYNTVVLSQYTKGGNLSFDLPIPFGRVKLIKSWGR